VRDSLAVNKLPKPPTYMSENYCPLLQVRLPSGESVALWVAAHAVDFYNDLDTIRRLCKELQQEPTWNSFSPGQGYPADVAHVPHEENGENNNRNTLTRTSLMKSDRRRLR